MEDKGREPVEVGGRGHDPHHGRETRYPVSWYMLTGSASAATTSSSTTVQRSVLRIIPNGRYLDDVPRSRCTPSLAQLRLGGGASRSAEDPKRLIGTELRCCADVTKPLRGCLNSDCPFWMTHQGITLGLALPPATRYGGHIQRSQVRLGPCRARQDAGPRRMAALRR